MIRRLFTTAAVASLLLCLLFVALWAVSESDACYLYLTRQGCD